MLFQIRLNNRGVSYKQKIDDALVDIPLDAPRAARATQRPFADKLYQEDVNESNAASVEYIVTQINACIQDAKRSSAIGVVTMSVVLAVCSAALLAFLLQSNAARIAPAIYRFLVAAPIIVPPVILVCGGLFAQAAHKRDQLARITTLHYELDETTANRFLAVQNAFADLGQSVGIWQVFSQKTGWDLKRSKAPIYLVDRKQITLGYMRPPFIRTRVKVYGMSLDAMQWFFLPDQIFVFEKGKYRSMRYDSIQMSYSILDYSEAGPVPDDARVRGHVWEHARKDGGPDLRYKDNRQIPILRYGRIELRLRSGQKLHLHVSNAVAAHEFTQTLKDYIHNQPARTASEKSSADSQQKQKRTSDIPRTAQECYAVLGVAAGASMEEISAAYRRMARMYHPDKVAGLAPEFRDLAEQRMKAINVAYQQLKRSFQS